MERRNQERRPSSLSVKVVTDTGLWEGNCINLSDEGALIRLKGVWDGARELEFRFADLPEAPPATRARVVRASSPDPSGSLLAIRFLTSHGIPRA